MVLGPALPLISLITDFGLSDPYVGQLKGALLKGCPFATLIDITHALPAWDVVIAALTLRTSCFFFPQGSIHVVVVDPAVGSRRSILVAAGEGHFFVAPDNGILSLLLAEHKIETVHRVENPAYVAVTASPTFQGRDIMAPVAAALARGAKLSDFGSSLPLESLCRVVMPSVVSAGNTLTGQVLQIDHFGNIRTTFRVGGNGFDPAAFGSLEIRGQRITQLAAAYYQVPVGALLALVDSSGYLEIAAHQASAAGILGCAPGDRIILHLGERRGLDQERGRLT